jgi:integrase
MAETFQENPAAPKKRKAEPKAKEKLTDRRLKTLKPADKPFEIMDLDVRGFGIRVMPSGVKSFILFRRFPGSKNPARRSLGIYGEMSLAEARDKAREWNASVENGIDPTIEKSRQRAATIEAEKQRQASTFGAAFEHYLKRKALRLKSGNVIEREIRRECKSWMVLPLADIHQRDVKELIASIATRGETQAHAIFRMLRAFFNWIIDTGDFDLQVSPCAKIKPNVLIAAPEMRDRVLKDFEIAASWRASEAIGYPFGKLYQLLFLTALRRNEAADAQWSEIDFDAGLWVIPGPRMKSGAPHAVPLVAEILALLKSLPRFAGGDYLFSTMGGKVPVSGFSKAKARLDKLMLMDLEAQGLPFEPFVLHDIRRTCRTRFSALPVEDIVRELLVAHARPGLHKVYDLHAYEKEKADALKLWHEKLKHIVGNLVL